LNINILSWSDPGRTRDGVTLRENGELMDPEKIIDGLSKELNSALKAMAKAKDLDEKEVYSRIVKNLCESLGVFFNLASEMMSDLENEDIPF
jgi:RecJ-like exonuclease